MSLEEGVRCLERGLLDLEVCLGVGLGRRGPVEGKWQPRQKWQWMERRRKDEGRERDGGSGRTEQTAQEGEHV